MKSRKFVYYHKPEVYALKLTEKVYKEICNDLYSLPKEFHKFLKDNGSKNCKLSYSQSKIFIEENIGYDLIHHKKEVLSGQTLIIEKGTLYVGEMLSSWSWIEIIH